LIFFTTIESEEPSAISSRTIEPCECDTILIATQNETKQTRNHRNMKGSLQGRKRGALGHLSFGAPSRCELLGCLSEIHESMLSLCSGIRRKFHGVFHSV